MGLIKKIINKIKGIDIEYSYNIYENGEFELMKKISNSLDTMFDAIEILEITLLMLLKLENDSFDCK